jgi:hypothetical protein
MLLHKHGAILAARSLPNDRQGTQTAPSREKTRMG